METTHDFLEALGLDEAAQERDIRRAYARKLKQIDQEREPAAFQALRGAYEIALDWARWKLAREAQDVPADAPPDIPVVETAVPVDAAPPAPSPRPEPQPRATEHVVPAPQADPAQLGAAVYRRFLADASALAALPGHGEVPAWRAAIEARFGDDELVNIDARVYFEAYVASLLASGWHPGHEILFVGAQEAFGWAADPRGLRQLGQAGRMLDQAIEERRLFEALPPAERTRMRDLVKMLRRQELPATRRIRAAMPDTERMLGRFPAFMAVVTPTENVERWRTVYRESGGPPIAAEEDMHIPPAPEPGFVSRRVAAFVILAIIALSFVLSSSDNKQGRQRSSSSSTQAFNHDSGAPVVADAVLRAAVPPVYYNPEPGTDTGKLEAVFKVFLGADHKVERVQNWQTSGNPAFDNAVTEALKSAKAFPPDTPREFQVTYTGGKTRPGEAPRSARAGKPAAPELTLDLLRKHLPPVQYTPFPYAKPGEYKGIYEVELDAAGKVADFRVRKSSGDVRLDQAVEESARAAKAFPPGTRGFQFTYGTTIFLKQRSKEAPREEAQESKPQDAGQADAEPGAEPEAGQS